MEEYEKLIMFSELIGKLKDTERTGWVVNKIGKPESIADHLYSVSILSMILSDKFDVDEVKVLKMALVHDLAESIIGDIITSDGTKIISDPKKKAADERKAMIKVLAYIDKPEYLKLFDEFEAGKTNEAILVKQLDKLEMALQALVYEKRVGRRLDSFYSNVRKALTDPYLVGFLEAIEKQRPNQ